MSKRPDFLGLFRFSEEMDFLDFCISVFLDSWVFIWISGHISGTKRATADPLVSKRPELCGLFRFSEETELLDFLVSGFLYFLDFWPYLVNEKSFINPIAPNFVKNFV